MTKKRPAEDPEREERIEMEIIVDAYGPEERAMSWYYYLQDALNFPFTATCIAKLPTQSERSGRGREPCEGSRM
jgi:hypothetical protein